MKWLGTHLKQKMNNKPSAEEITQTKILCHLNGSQVINIRIGPSTGGKWMIDFANSTSREGTKEEIDYVWDSIHQQRKQERELKK